jgi:hypothetical protein
VTDPVAVARGLFVLLKMAGDLPDPEVDEFYEAAEAEQAAWERRKYVNMVLAPVPVRVDWRMRPVAS